MQLRNSLKSIFCRTATGLGLLATCTVAVGDDAVVVVVDDEAPSRLAQAALAKTVMTVWNESELAVSIRPGRVADTNAAMVFAKAEAIASACSAGLLMQTNILDSLRSGFGAATRCGTRIAARRTMLGYRFTNAELDPPGHTRALFDTSRWPGKRALIAKPESTLEWALMSYNVPHQNLYELLSTERGLALAFKRLDKIKAHTIWCRNASCAANALKSGEASMALLNDASRTLSLLDNAASEISAIGDSLLLDYFEIALTKTDVQKNRHNAAQLLLYITSTDSVDELTRRGNLVAEPPAGVTVRDGAWYAHTRHRLTERFNDWLEGTPVRD